MNQSAIYCRRIASIVILIAIVLGCDTMLTFSGGGGTTTTGDVGLPAESTRSFFTAFQIDPVEEDSAGPKFVAAGDIDKDGLTDLISGWNQSQPVQLHLQRRDTNGVITFRTITIAGTFPVAVIAGLEVGQLNDDDNNGVIDSNDWLDIVVLIKADGSVAQCPPKACGSSQDCPNGQLCIDGCCNGDCRPRTVSTLNGQIALYFNPATTTLIPDGDSWSKTLIVNPLVVWIDAGTQWSNQYPGNQDGTFEESKTKPESSGLTSLVVANMDRLNGDDIIVAMNPARCDALGQNPPINTVDLYVNPGGVLSESPTGWGAPVTVMTDLPQVKDVKVMDIDSDGNLDIIATYPTAITRNIRWARNPLTGAAITTAWENRPIGQVDTHADIMDTGDIDNDGFDDIVVRSTNGQIMQWFRRPNALAIPPEFPPPDTVPSRFSFPWPVFTMTEIEDQEPEAIAVGDVTGDGRVEVMLAREGGVFWYDGTVGTSVFDPWQPNTIISANQTESTIDSFPGSGVGVSVVDTSSVINSLLVVDVDGDGMNDIVGTLDRRSGAGLSDDRLVWYRNTRTP